MNTRCCSNNDQLELEFQGFDSRKVVSKFEDGYVEPVVRTLQKRQL